MYKIAIIGGGVVGGLIARAMAKYEGSLVILEKESDVAMGQSKANSGIVHAGYDPEPGSLKAHLNVRGSQMMEQVCRELDVKYRKNGTLVVGFDDDDMKRLTELLERGRENGVEGLELIDGETVRKMEKNLSENIVGALYAPTGAVVCPYELTLHSIGNAMDNGAKLITEFEVAGIDRRTCETQGGEFYEIHAADGRTVEAQYVVNCAGIHSDEVSRLVCESNFFITPRRGQYLLLDKEAGDMVSATIFRTPTRMGKGVLAARTVDGNILLGPTSEDVEDKEDKAVTAEGMASVISREYEFFDSLPMDKVITQFTGLRAHGSTGDFIIEIPLPGFINCAGIESPGLSASPAIAEMVENMLIKAGAAGKVKPDYEPKVKGIIRFKEMTFQEKNRLIAERPQYGRVVCRCEEITEGEIIDAIRRNPQARDVDGVKRRTRAGMGRCQGGFCMPSVAEILSEELGIPFEQVTKSGEGSEITFGRTKTGGEK